MLHVRSNKKQKGAAAATAKNAANSTKPEEDDHNAVVLSVQRYSIFNQQNVETGHFDVTFQFKEKELHAHSFILWSASEVFEAMLLGQLAKKEPIPITTYSFEDFKEFLTFLYRGKCSITMDNIMVLVDLAEFYNVQLLKDKCDHFLTNMTPTAETVFKICETLKLYSLKNALENMYEFIAINATTLLKTPTFLNTTKDVVIDIVKMERLVIKEEELFDAVYKWAEFQHQKQDPEKPASIKDLLSDILPHIRFPVMDIEYLHDHIVPLGGLFESFTELSQILKDAGNFQKKTLTQPASKYPNTMRKSFNIEIKDNRGNVARAYIHDTEFIKRLVKMNENQILQCYATNNGNYYDTTPKEFYWSINISKPETKNSNIMDLNACKLYIIRNSQGLLGLKDLSPPSENEIAENIYAPMFQMMFQNQQNNRLVNPNGVHQNHSNEFDIIARVYPENNTFTIGQGCILKVVSGNGNPTNDPRNRVREYQMMYNDYVDDYD